MARSSPEQVIVHAVGERWPWAVIDRQGRVRDSGESDPGHPDWPADDPVSLLVDAGRCMGLKIDLPQMPRARMERALRWAAEEHLAGGAEDEHVVAGDRDDHGRLRCVVINETVMRDLAGTLTGRAERMVPDALCLPWAPGELALAEAGGRILARWDEWSFGSFEPELAAEILDATVSAEVERIWYGGERPGWLDAAPYRDLSDEMPLLARLAPGVERSGINLLSGPWSPRSAVAARSQWRWAGILAAGALALAVGVAAVERYQLAHEAEALQAEIEQRFLEIFPDTPRVVRPREQAEREMARLRFGQSAGLLDLLNRTAPVIEGQAEVVLDGINYRDGELELSLRAPDVATLDQLEQRLRALDLVAEVRSASLDEDGARGRISIREAG